MKRIKVIFPKAGTSKDVMIKVGDGKQFQIKLTTFGDTDDTYQLSNGDVLVASKE